MNSVDAFLALIDIYRTSTGLAEATVSSRLFNDGKRIASIRDGSDIGVRRLSTAMNWISDNWPPDANWPDHIQRPHSPEPSPSDEARALSLSQFGAPASNHMEESR